MMENQAKPKLPPFLWALMAVSVVAPLVPLLQHFGKPQLIPPAFCAIVTIAATVKVCWELRSHCWFWPTIVLLAVVNSLLIILLPWPKGWIPAPYMLVGCIVDLFFMLAVLSSIEKLGGPGGGGKDQE